MKDIVDLWDKYYNPTDITQIYIHNPFCNKVCTFCAYGGKKSTEKNLSYYYDEYLPQAIKKHTQIINKFAGQTYWFGGGTPNLMTPKQMHNIFSLLSLNKLDNHKVIEAHPNHLTKEKIDIMKMYKFNTIALGVQTLNTNVLDKHNREYVDYNKLKELISYIKKCGMYVSIDILLLEGSSTSILYDDLISMSNLGVEEIVVAYDYLWDGIKEINKSFSNVVEKFLSKTNYNKQHYVGDIEEFMSKYNGIQATLGDITNDQVLKYVYCPKPDKINRISTLGIGSWNGTETFSVINNKVEYVSKIIDNNEVFNITLL